MRNFSRLSQRGITLSLMLAPYVLFIATFFASFTFSHTSNAQFFSNYGYYQAKKRKKLREQEARRRALQQQRAAQARRNKRKDPPIKGPIFNVEAENKEPIHIVVSVPKQQAKVYKGDKVVATTRVSTGKPGHSTPSGIYSIIQKNRRHFSNLYGNAPMPYMQRITWSGIALHQGVVPGYPASHGCIRLPGHFARKLFKFTEMGAHVIVTRDKEQASPIPLKHASLFQPAEPLSEEAEETALINDPEVQTITASIARETAAPFDYKSPESQYGIPSHVERLKGRERIKAVQRLLNYLGYDAGRPDGDMGATTRKAIRQFQYDFTMKKTGKITADLFNKLYKHANREDIALGRDPNNPEHAKALQKPVRVLITRRSKTETIKDVQRILRFLKYYDGYADGTLGRNTRKAIKKFQYDFMMKRTGVISEELVQRLYKHANWGEISTGHIYVRQDFKDIFDMPLVIREKDKPLGTHIFTALHFDKSDSEARWIAQTMESRGTKAKKKWDKRKGKMVVVRPATPPATTTAKEALDRVQIPAEARRQIEAILTPGSSIIVADKGWRRETGLGTDFIVQP